MAFHLVIPRRSNIQEQSRLAKEGKSPRHSLALIADRLNATVHEPSGDPTADSRYFLKGKVLPTASLWSLADRIAKQVSSDDVIFCASEAAGLQIAATYSGRRRRPRLAVFAHNIDRPRTRLAMRWWKMADTIDVFFACSEYQVEFLRKYLNLSEDRVRFIWDHTDTAFFTPGPAKAKARPMIVSVGLEQRDYKTLALATSHLDVDVRISGFSKDAKAQQAFPDVLPNNMDRRFYSWGDLLQLYRDADVIVVSCEENKYAAGVQSLMEGSSCKRPIIATSTSGLRKYINETVIAVAPLAPSEMEAAIKSILRDPVSADARAASAHEIALQTFGMERYVEEVSQALLRL